MKKWLDNIIRYFPASQSVKKNEPTSLLVSLVVYLAMVGVCFVVLQKVLALIPGIGILFHWLFVAAQAYGMCGILYSLYLYYREII